MKPLTQSEITRALLRAVNGQRTQRPVVTIKTTAKGEVQVEVTAYGKTALDAGTSAMAEFDRVRDRYRLEHFIDHETYDAAVQDGTPFD